MTCFIVNIEEKPDGAGILVQVQRFDGANVTNYDMELLAVFREGDVERLRLLNPDGTVAHDSDD